MTSPPIPPRLGLAAAVIAFSFPAIFIRFADADSLSISFLRLAIAAVLLLPFAASGMKSAWLHLTNLERRRVIAAGVFLGAHMFLWVTSVTKTTVASASFLIITQPILVAVLGHFLLQEKLNRWVIWALVLTLVGSALINIGDLHLKPEYLFGDLLALLGAVMAAFYLLAGRSVRRKIALIPYITIVYSIAALVLLPLCLYAQSPILSLSSRTYFWCLLLALIPTIIGHGLFNWALRYLKAFTVNSSIIVEPIGATIMAWFFFREQPGVWLYPGATLLIFALILGQRSEET